MTKAETNINWLMIEKYTKGGYWKNKTLCDFLEGILQRNPNKIAIVDGRRRLSFRDIDRLSNIDVNIIICNGN